MAPDVTKSNRFEPLHQAHAIEQVSCAVQFGTPLADNGIKKASEIANGFKAELPGGGPTQGIRFQFGPGIVPAQAAVSGGVVRTKSRADGVVESELRVERQLLSFRTILYTRWDKVWGEAGKYFGELLPIYAASAKVAGINLSYVDKFVWSGDPTACRPADLLKPGSKYVAPHVFDQNDFWHSYTGAFVRNDDRTKRLVNVNVDYLEESSDEKLRRVVAITTVLTDLMNQDGYTPFELAPDTASKEVGAHMQDLHNFAKIAFGDVINAEMSKRIDLGI